MKAAIFCVIISCSLFSACFLKNRSINKHSTVSPENAIICEIGSRHSYSEIIKMLVKFQSSYINTLCVIPPSSKTIETFDDLVDSCHQHGISILLHAPYENIQAHMISNFDVDGFHCINTMQTGSAEWNKKLDELSHIKPVLLIADSLDSTLLDAGFDACESNVLSNALKTVISANATLSNIDSAVAFESQMYLQNRIHVIRDLPLISEASEQKKMSEVFTISMIGLRGIPYINIEQLETKDSFYTRLLEVYNNSWVLQSGKVEATQDSSDKIFLSLREFKGERVLTVINLRDKPALYKWPANVNRSNMKWLLGEPLAQEGGQLLPPYGYQMLYFKYIEGMDPFALDIY